MTMIKRVSAVAAAVAMCLTFATPVAAADNTVGHFIQRLALSKGLVATDARVANDALRGVGIRLPRDLSYSKKLTEGDVAVISRAAGLNVHSSNPDNAFTQGAVEVFFVNFGGQLGDETADHNPGEGSGPGNGNSGPAFDPFTKGKQGKGKGKGHVSPSEPE